MLKRALLCCTGVIVPLNMYCCSTPEVKIDPQFRIIWYCCFFRTYKPRVGFDRDIVSEGNEYFSSRYLFHVPKNRIKLKWLLRARNCKNGNKFRLFRAFTLKISLRSLTFFSKAFHMKCHGLWRVKRNSYSSKPPKHNRKAIMIEIEGSSNGMKSTARH